MNGVQWEWLTGRILAATDETPIVIGYAYWHPSYPWARIWVTPGVNGGWVATEWLTGRVFTWPQDTHQEAFAEAIKQLDIRGRDAYERAVRSWIAP